MSDEYAITIKEIKEMTMREAKELVYHSSINDLRGSGCGPGHRIPTGERRRKLQIALAKIHKSLYGEYPYHQPWIYIIKE